MLRADTLRDTVPNWHKAIKFDTPTVFLETVLEQLQERQTPELVCMRK